MARKSNAKDLNCKLKINKATKALIKKFKNHLQKIQKE